jgi:hypothetical protein
MSQSVIRKLAPEENIKQGSEKMKTKKSKKRRLVESQDESEPDFLGAALSKTRKSHEIPTLYKEDLGNQGLKSKRDLTVAEVSFEIRLTKDEKRRRKERQVDLVAKMFSCFGSLCSRSFSPHAFSILDEVHQLCCNQRRHT